MSKSTNAAYKKLLEKSENKVKDSYDRKAALVLLAGFIKNLRINAGLSQAELASITGKKQSAIGRYESYNNSSMPSVETLILISHACGYDLRIEPTIEIKNNTYNRNIQEDSHINMNMNPVQANLAITI